MQVSRPGPVGHHSLSSRIAAPSAGMQLSGASRSSRLCSPSRTVTPGGRCTYNPNSSSSSSRRCPRLRRAAQQQQHDAHHSQAAEEEGEGGADVPDLFAPLPPSQQASLGRKRKVALLIAAAMLEISLTGTAAAAAAHALHSRAVACQVVRDAACFVCVCVATNRIVRACQLRVYCIKLAQQLHPCAVPCRAVPCCAVLSQVPLCGHPFCVLWAWRSCSPPRQR